ncbi:hypothetical protein VNI00_018369 [Paramarasmius palmivorus]|uniref:F-box domain-containing protein n=1 Tax=Paramarasmius palmivorus TaxID=297713 RepID=A0AAW0AZ10_9AGAR
MIPLLATELLCEIFACALWDKDADFTSLLDLVAVCHRWRSVALTTPCLWQRLVIKGLRACHVEMAREWFSRAGAFPLTVHVSEHQYDVSAGFPPTFTSFLKELLRVSSQWEDIALIPCDLLLLPCTPSELPFDARKLKHLKIAGSILPLSTSDYFGKVVLENRLCSIDWSGTVYTSYKISLLDNSRSSLSTLTCSFDIADASSLILFPNLLNLELHLWSDPDTTSPENVSSLPVVVLKLTGSCVAKSSFIRHFTCPKVARLDLGFEDSETMEVSDITFFITQSHCSLSSLRVAIDAPSRSEWAKMGNLLLAVRMLPSLHISFCETPHLSSYPDFPNLPLLRDLRVVQSLSSCSVTHLIDCVCSPALEELYLEDADCHQTLLFGVLLRRCTNLRILSIIISPKTSLFPLLSAIRSGGVWTQLHTLNVRTRCVDPLFRLLCKRTSCLPALARVAARCQEAEPQFADALRAQRAILVSCDIEF